MQKYAQRASSRPTAVRMCQGGLPTPLRPSNPSAAAVRTMFDRRAPDYDAGNGGWHIDLARDFVTWSAPRRGDKVLDLACGTGLVTYRAAQAVGHEGLVVGIDLTRAMLDEAKKKRVLQGSTRIEWIEHDMSNLDDVKVIQDVVRSDGGFDLITCCSALIFLPSPTNSIKHWSRFLKPGGRMIIDVPTENRGIHQLWFNDLRQAVGLGYPFKANWVRDIHSLEKHYMAAGLEIEKSWRTHSYWPEQLYDGGDRDKVFEEYISRDPSIVEKGKLQQAREIWPEIWKNALRADGKLWVSHALYLTIGVKKGTE